MGTVLRILIAVNGAAFAAALVRESKFESFSSAWLDIVSVVEPNLLLMLLVLYAIAPWLQGVPYRMAAIVVSALTIAVVIGVFFAIGTVAEGSILSLFRQLALALSLAIVLLYYFHLRAKALSPAIVEARLQALQARIRPHFLFNSLNAVLSLVRNEPRRAETALEDLADLFRVLMRDNRQLTPLGDEIELCRQYLELEKLRLGDRLGIEWHIDNMPHDALVPPLVLQPLLENAVYHGIEPSSAAGIIAINIFLRRGEVHAVLRNPYRMEGGHHKGNKMAIANIRERLALHFDAEASLESRVTNDSYEVHIRMPYHSASRTREKEHA